MFGPTFADYYRKTTEQFSQDVLAESDAQILGSDVNELAEFYLQRYALVPLQFDLSSLSYEHKKKVRRVPANQRNSFYRSQGDTNFEFEFVVVSLRIQPNPNLQLFKELSGGTRYLDGFDESVQYNNQEIFFSFDTKWYGGHLEEDSIAREINEKSDRLLKSLTEKNSAIESGNAVLLQAIKNTLEARKQKLLADKEKLSSLTQKVKIPLKARDLPNMTKIQVGTRDFVRAVKPTPKLPEEYVLEESELEKILSFVDSQCKTFEKTPGSYRQLGEEQLRDIILSSLNSIFDGNATGETFQKKGKTDIHLKIEKGEILIFECKFWGGEKIYSETINQLMGYVTWRQNYGVIVFFSRNKDFMKILSQIPGIIQKHPQYKSGFRQIGSNHFLSDHTLPEDSGKVIRVHHLIYNVYSE